MDSGQSWTSAYNARPSPAASDLRTWRKGNGEGGSYPENSPHSRATIDVDTITVFPRLAELDINSTYCNGGFLHWALFSLNSLIGKNTPTKPTEKCSFITGYMLEQKREPGKYVYPHKVCNQQKLN